MNDAAILTSVKTDLGIMSNVYDTRLTEYIKGAEAAIKREGIALTDNVEDRDLVARYAAWLWKKRDSGQGLPKMIRWQLNNKIFGKKEDAHEG